jgi:rod shape determining protein RodA
VVPLWKGMAQWTQKNMHFLPEHHTDFIFSVIGEEFGFIGSLVLIGYFSLLL